jgi:predicted PurR-regulated permease PerM
VNQKAKLGDTLLQFSRSRRFKLFVFALIIFLLLLFVFSLRDIFIPVMIGGMIAYILEPLVKLVMRIGLGRVWAILLIYVTMFFMATLIITASGIGLSRQIGQLMIAIEGDTPHPTDSTKPPLVDHNGDGKYDMGYRLKLHNKLKTALENWNKSHSSTFQIDEQVVKESVLESLLTSSNSEDKEDFHFFKYLSKKIADNTGETINWGIIFVMIPIYGFLLQRLAPQMRQTFPGLIPLTFRDRTLKITSKINLELSAFFRGKLMVCLIKGFLTWIALWLFDVNYAFFIGFLAGALSIIPYLGAVIGFLLAIMVTLLDKGSNGPIAAITIVFVFMEIVEFGLHILIFGREVGVHPLAFILSLFIGGSLFGVFGVIMAVPLLSVASILWREFIEPLIKDLSVPSESQMIEIKKKSDDE